MKEIVLINPNTNARTTAMMTAIARTAVPADLIVRGLTAASGVPMITNERELDAAARETLRLGREAATSASALIVAAFGDPGLAQLRSELRIPVAGLAESAMLEAGKRRFGIATTTPGLVGAMRSTAAGLGLEKLLSGVRLTPGDPFAVTADPERLLAALEKAARACIEEDGTEAVIIGGGPLGQAAEALRKVFSVPVIAPIPAALRRAAAALAG